MQGIVDALDPLLAVVYNSRYDVLATNAAYRDLFLLPKIRAGLPNVLWTVFTAAGGSLSGWCTGRRSCH
ncbi:hypothetical protein GCM10017687_19980 [Streptomyces echinatus]|uniref:MmyB family transcriptional regulator n=1 Tax=Streptomyces echinatus TaxID=67293 RepID=UPI0031F11287